MNREISVDLLSDMGLVVDTAEDGDIALSANAFEEDRMNSLKAGMNDHVSKPIDKRVLIDVMLRYI